MTFALPRLARRAFAAAAVVILASYLTGLAVSPLAAQAVMEKAARDDIAEVPDNDPEMAGAIRKAQATLADFLALAAAPRTDTEGFAIKVAVREGEHAEFFWITPFANKGGQFSGEINNEPRMVHSVRMGQTITFAQSDIVDWLYIEHGMMKGNFTACALLKSEPKNEAEEFKKVFRLNCDL
jgi:uncharacterized protein YegJ (DUF2314 family)